MSGPDFEVKSLELPFPVAAMDPTVPDGDSVAQDGGVLIMPAAGADAQPTYIPQSVLDADAKLASALLNLVPVVGKVKGVIEAFKGEDLVTGDHLEWWDRGLKVVFAVPVPEPEEEAPALAHTVHEMYEVGERAHQAYEVYEAGHAVHEVNEANEEAEKTYGGGELDPPDLSGER